MHWDLPHMACFQSLNFLSSVHMLPKAIGVTHPWVSEGTKPPNLKAVAVWDAEVAGTG